MGDLSLPLFRKQCHLMLLQTLSALAFIIGYTNKGFTQNRQDQGGECILIRGEIVREIALVSRTNIQEFEVISDGTQWKIRLPNAKTNAPVLFWEYGTDSDAVYKITAFNTNYDGAMLHMQKNGNFKTNIGGFKGKIKGQAFVSKTALPTEGDSTVAATWMAYLAGAHLTFLQENSHFELPPIYAAPLNVMGLGDNIPDAFASWSLSEKYPHSPTYLTLFGGPTFSFSDAGGKGRTIINSNGPTFTNLVFSREGNVAIGGWTFASQFKLDVFVPSQDGKNGTAQKLVESLKGRTITIEKIARPPSFLPVLANPTRVFDQRIHNNKLASYLASNTWPSESAIRNESVEAITQSRRNRKVSNQGVNALPVFIMVGAFALASFVWISRRQKKR
jgi:hypothetical protein